jgi:hypothetical protein
MDHHTGRITIIASSTMVHHRVRCMICDRPVDHRVVFMTNDARVLHAGCVPDHVKVPIAVLLQAIRRLERMVERVRTEKGGPEDPAIADGAAPGADAAAGTAPGTAAEGNRANAPRPDPASAPASGADPQDPDAPPGA